MTKETKTKHTPGPWRSDFNEVNGKDGLVVALATANRNAKEVESNANLIASAPDLLEACKRSLETLERFNCHYECEKILKQAIAKADGDV